MSLVSIKGGLVIIPASRFVIGHSLCLRASVSLLPPMRTPKDAKRTSGFSGGETQRHGDTESGIVLRRVFSVPQFEHQQRVDAAGVVLACDLLADQFFDRGTLEVA